MKNQYFGDIYDYIKYGLLRQLSGYGKLRTVVCWMLTKDDDRADGHHIHYLHKPAEWKSFDPDVFDYLRLQVLDQKHRNVDAIEESGLLPNSRFYSDYLSDDITERQEYFAHLLELTRESELTFFDPDNGVEVKSVRYGKRGSSRYLFWHEVERFFSAGRSLLVYQHMPPKPREPVIRQLVDGFARSTQADMVYVFGTKRVTFFLIPQSAQMEAFHQVASMVQTTWGRLLAVQQHKLT